MSALLLTLAVVPLARAADEPYTAREVQAAFLHKLLFFVEWPDLEADASVGPVHIGIVGNDPRDDELESVASQQFHGRSIVVERVDEQSDLGQLQILFLGGAEREALEPILAKVSGQPVLTVGDSRAVIEAGGVLRFFEADGRIRLQISRSAYERQGLNISSQLLSVAEVVP